MSTPDKSKRRPKTPAAKTPTGKGKDTPKSAKSSKSGGQSTKSKPGQKPPAKSPANTSSKNKPKKSNNSDQSKQQSVRKNSKVPGKSPATPAKSTPQKSNKSVKSTKGGAAKKTPAKPPAKPVTAAAAKKAKNDEKHQQLQNIFAERHKEKQQKKIAARPPEDNEKTCMEDEEDTPATMEMSVRILEIFKHNNWLESALLQRDNEKLENFFAGDVANATMEIVLLIEEALERALGLLFMGLDYGLPSDLRKFALHDRVQLRLLTAILTHKQYLPQSWGGRIVLLTEENAKNENAAAAATPVKTPESEASPAVKDGALMNKNAKLEDVKMDEKKEAKKEEVKVEVKVEDKKEEAKKEPVDDARPKLPIQSPRAQQPQQKQRDEPSVYIRRYY